MQRIPNPVSDLTVFVRVFCDLQKSLKARNHFELDDISRAMIASGNVTSQGAIGKEALRRSTRRNRSLDPIYNQSKMYAELFRTLGWIQSTRSSLTYSFSLLGEHIAVASDPIPLVQECLLGIAYPNEVLDVQTKQKIRVLAAILLTLDNLTSISRDEIMAGPMNVADDTNKSRFDAMNRRLRSYRNQPGRLDEALDAIAATRAIKRSPTMENYTRFPIAAFVWANWAIKSHRGVLTITDAGRSLAARLRSAKDVRLQDFDAFPDAAKPAFIRFSFYNMLGRAGFNLDPVREGMIMDAKLLAKHDLPHGTDLYFSPFQQLSAHTINKWVPEFVRQSLATEHQLEQARDEAPFGKDSREAPVSQLLHFELTGKAVETEDTVGTLKQNITRCLKQSKNHDDAVKSLYDSLKDVNRDTFYPLVVDLFCILGFNCKLSRGGQNYERADAMIPDSKQSIPIEIKSPGEEMEVSVKGVRQALENKVVLLARQNYPTHTSTTSLVVGYNAPNDRSEVHQLIEDIYKTFNVRIAVFDIKSLLSLAIYAVKSGHTLHLREFHRLKGVINANSLAPTS